jgi:hypothetical protein
LETIEGRRREFVTMVSSSLTAHDNSRPGSMTHPQTKKDIERKAGYRQIDGSVDEA